MDDQLRAILRELVQEFSLNKLGFQSSPQFQFSVKIGQYASQGIKRYSKNHSYQKGICFQQGVLYMLLGYFIKDFKSSKKLYEFIAANKLWFEEFDSYEISLNTMPSVIARIGGGFLCRNFEINNYQIEITEQSFEIALKELLVFFKKDYVTYDIYIHLRGLKGDLPNIELTELISIEKADFELAKLYSINYFVNQVHGVEMFEGDYVLRIKFQVTKADFRLSNLGKYNQFQNQIIEKWKILPVLAIPGFLDIGKMVKLSNDWPVVYDRTIGPYGREIVQDHFSFTPFSEDMIPLLKVTAKQIDELNELNLLDKKIRYSIERLIKSKSSRNIDDRVVELSIAFEYLINTTDKDITLQLCLKVIKLVYETNSDEVIFKNLKGFYGLRSKVIHGVDKLDNGKHKVLVDFAESVIQLAMVRMIELNKKNTFKEIDEALTKSLYISQPVSQLLVSPQVKTLPDDRSSQFRHKRRLRA